MSSIKLSVGMAHYDDPRVMLTIQNIAMNHALQGIEFVIVDNSPNTPYGKSLEDFCAKAKGGGALIRYIPMPDSPSTTQTRQRIFDEAQGESVLVMDCHVLPVAASLQKLIRFYDDHPDCMDLLSGPLLNEANQVYATHFSDVWGEDGMWGKWGTDERGKDPNGEPFEIFANGLYLFSCRKEAWLGFNPHFRGFGGEECYIHEKFRKAGRKALCLPFLGAWHDFSRPGGVRYPLRLWDKLRNYVLGHQELQLDMTRLHAHYVLGGHFSQKAWDSLVADPIRATQEPPSISKPAPAGRPQPLGNVTLDGIFHWAKSVPRDLDQHLDKLKELAEKCDHVTQFTKRRESTVAFAAARPHTLITYQLEEDPLTKTLHKAVQADADAIRAAGGTRCIENLKHVEGPDADSLIVPPIAETDLLYIDTIHHADRTWRELERHLPSVKRFLILRGTGAFGEKAEGIDGPGLLLAARRLMHEKPEWKPVYHTTAEYGITVFSRMASDHPAEAIDIGLDPGFGPGTELSEMLSTLGINPGPSCDCKAKARQMNIWGVKGCQEHRDEIVKGIVDNAPRWGWVDKLKAAALAVTTGLAFKLDVTDPYGSLVDEAIRRAEVKQEAKESL